MVLNSIRLKELNTELVKSALKIREFGTKNSIAGDTGLSVATCRNILDELTLSGEVKEVEMGPSTGGRPARRFVYNEDYAFLALMYLRIEGNRKSIHRSVVNMTGKKVFEKSDLYDDISLEDIDEVVESLIGEYPLIRVISIGIPGVVNKGEIGFCDLKKLRGLNIEGHLSVKFDIAVTSENDVNSTALGYYKRLEAAVPESLVYIYYPEDGIAGAGIVINGKVLRGRTNFAGEISYMPMWVERNEQGRIQKDKSLFTELITDTILSINCLINPESIIIAGRWITDEMKQSIYSAVASAASGEHIPGIDFECDIHSSYLDGLKYAGLQKLTCGFEVVERSYK